MRVTARSGSEAVRALLARHPHVDIQNKPCDAVVEFVQEGKTRRVWQNRPDVQPFGLLEIMDNNPLVCAEECSVPSPEGTLALIAVGPLIRAGILKAPPAVLFSFESNLSSIVIALESVEWESGVTTGLDEPRESPVLSAVFMSAISSPEDPNELDALYDGIYGSSFFVRRIEDGPWVANLVEDRPFAAYRLRLAPDEGESLLTVQVMSAPEGKCGAAQVVHAMNLMCGFEESLGVSR